MLTQEKEEDGDIGKGAGERGYERLDPKGFTFTGRMPANERCAIQMTSWLEGRMTRSLCHQHLH